jgi:hypothetical protein
VEVEANMTGWSAEEWKERQTFYSSVGQAISLWTSMETRLVMVASVLMGTSERKAGLVLYSIMNFYTWLSIMDDLFQMDPDFQTLQSEWAAVQKKLKGMNDTRNRLAHHTAWEQPDDDPSPALRPGKYDARTKSQKHDPLTIRAILEFTKEVSKLKSRLFALWKEMIALRTKSTGEAV